MNTTEVVEPYVGCTFSTTKGVVIVESSKETEPDGFGGFLYDLEVRHVRGGTVERMVNLSARTIEEALNRAEMDALATYEEGLERQHRRKKRLVANCAKCGDLTTVPDKFAKARIEQSHQQLRHSDD